MNNHRCISQKSLITVRKWLLEAGDGLSTSIYVPSSRFDRNVKPKSHLNKIIKRKRFNNQKSHSKTTSIIDWFFGLIKTIFTAYDESPLKYNDRQTMDDTTRSIMTCSTCQLENTMNTLCSTQSTLLSSKSNPPLYSKINSQMLVPSTTSNSNINTSPFIILHSSKFTQTQLNHNEPQAAIYPLYCFSIKDGQIFPLQFSSSSSQPPIASIPSSHSNLVSLQTTQNFTEDHVIPKMHRPSSSLHDTPICHFDKRNCLTECYHSSTPEKQYPSNFPRSSNTNTNAPEIVFAESTCQLIKQAWLSSTPDQQAHF